MRVRALDSNGDYTFGKGLANFWIDTPAAVAQEVITRLGLIQGEWYLDNEQGVPWKTQILGYNTQSTRDLVIKNTILTTPGVVTLNSYSSSLDPATRLYDVSAEIITAFGTTVVSTNLTVA